MTDQALIIQFQTGDAKEAAFTQLLKRHRETVFFKSRKWCWNMPMQMILPRLFGSRFGIN